MLSGLPDHLAAACFVVLHVRPDVPSQLPAILNRVGTLPVAHAVDGEPIRRGRVYIAPPGMQTYLHRGRIAVQRGPGEAVVPYMPLNAIQRAGADHVVQIADLPALLIDLGSRESKTDFSAEIPLETVEEAGPSEPFERSEEMGTLSNVTCPDCQGNLWEISRRQRDSLPLPRRPCLLRGGDRCRPVASGGAGPLVGAENAGGTHRVDTRARRAGAKARPPRGRPDVRGAVASRRPGRPGHPRSHRQQRDARPVSQAAPDGVGGVGRSAAIRATPRFGTQRALHKGWRRHLLRSKPCVQPDS